MMASIKLMRAFSKAAPFEFLQFQTTPHLKFEALPQRMPMFRVLDHQGNVHESKYETMDQGTSVKLFDTMITLRTMDDIYYNLQRQGRITFYMKELKEEAATLGTAAALDTKDLLFLQNREKSFMLWRGYTQKMLLHSLKATDNCKGRGRDMPMLYADEVNNIAPMQGPLGSGIPQSAGAGYFFAKKKMDKISVAFFGEGAASEGDADVSYNFASTLKSQTLFICRNNLYSISQLVNEQYSGDGVVRRGQAYGIPSMRVDGNDALAVFNAVKEAKKMVIERRAPMVLELMTYRGADHSTSDLAEYYRTPKVMESLSEYLDLIGDPIDRWEKYLQKKGWVNTEHRVKKEGEAKKQCMEAIKEVFQTKYPHPSEMFNFVYTEKPWNLVEQEKDILEIAEKYKDAYPVDEFKMK
jgi:2-oxoisovalerate dehydrogenase E1 component alpha subunit